MIIAILNGFGHVIRGAVNRFLVDLELICKELKVLIDLLCLRS